MVIGDFGFMRKSKWNLFYYKFFCFVRVEAILAPQKICN